MRYHLTVITLSVFLALGIYASISQISAQDGINDSDTTPGSGGTITNQTGNVTGVTSDDSFNAFWLLPLVAIPFLVYLLWPKSRREHSGHLAGAKGGSAKKEDEDYEPEPPRYRDEY